MFGMISGALSVASGIKGLFSKPKAPKERTPRDGILSQAQGAREAADKYGFNPLTTLQAGAGHGFSQGVAAGGAAPLASIDAITSGLAGIDDIVSGDAARRRAADQAELDLAQIRIDEAKRGVGFSQPRYSSAPSGPITGNRAATVAQPSMRSVPARFSVGQNPIAPGRKEDIAPLTNSPGVFEVENELTNGPITLPGEGEPWGFDELATGVAIGVPQILHQTIQDEREARQSMEPEELRARNRTRAAKAVRHPNGMLGAFTRAYELWN